MQSVAGELGGVQLGGAQSTQLGGDPRRPDACRVQQARAVHKLHGGAARRDRRTAAARVEARVEDSSVRTVAVEGDGNADQVAASGPSGRAGARIARHVTSSDRHFHVIGKLDAHRRSSFGLSRKACTVLNGPVCFAGVFSRARGGTTRLRPCVRASLDTRPPQPHIPSAIGPQGPAASARLRGPAQRHRSCPRVAETPAR